MLTKSLIRFKPMCKNETFSQKHILKFTCYAKTSPRSQEEWAKNAEMFIKILKPTPKRQNFPSKFELGYQMNGDQNYQPNSYPCVKMRYFTKTDPKMYLQCQQKSKVGHLDMNGQQNAIKISHLSKLQKELNSEINPIAHNHVGLQALVDLIPHITTRSSTLMSYFYSYSE